MSSKARIEHGGCDYTDESVRDVTPVDQAVDGFGDEQEPMPSNPTIAYSKPQYGTNISPFTSRKLSHTMDLTDQRPLTLYVELVMQLDTRLHFSSIVPSEGCFYVLSETGMIEFGTQKSVKISSSSSQKATKVARPSGQSMSVIRDSKLEEGVVENLATRKKSTISPHSITLPRESVEFTIMDGSMDDNGSDPDTSTKLQSELPLRMGEIGETAMIDSPNEAGCLLPLSKEYEQSPIWTTDHSEMRSPCRFEDGSSIHVTLYDPHLTGEMIVSVFSDFGTVLQSAAYLDVMNGNPITKVDIMYISCDDADFAVAQAYDHHIYSDSILVERMADMPISTESMDVHCGSENQIYRIMEDSIAHEGAYVSGKDEHITSTCDIYTVTVKHIPEDMCEDGILREMLSFFGEIRNVRLLRDSYGKASGIALIDFEDERDAHDCILELNESDICGVSLLAEPSGR